MTYAFFEELFRHVPTDLAKLSTILEEIEVTTALRHKN